MKKVINFLKKLVAIIESFIAFFGSEEPTEPTESTTDEKEPEVVEPIEEPIDTTDVEPEPEVEVPVESEPSEPTIDDPEPIEDEPNVTEQEPVVETVIDPTSIDVIAGEVLEGKWGSGAKRKANLEAAGYNYDEVQERVNQILTIVDEVLDGKWGNGDVRKQRLEEAGYVYKVIQDRINAVIASKTTVQDDICAWAKKIADSKKYKYKTWKAKDVKTHQCPICHPGSGDGWNCIGLAFATWHHGGQIPCNCNCGVIANATWEKILKAATYEEALKLAQKYVGIKEIQVLRNIKGIPVAQLRKGDIIAYFANGDEYKHTALYIGDSLMADSSGGNVGKYVTYGKKLRNGLNVAIRWTGDAKNKSIETLAKEVLDGQWGSGDARKLNLIAAGCDYDKVQAKVNELLDAKKNS